MQNQKEDPDSIQITPRTRRALFRFLLILAAAAAILLLIRFTVLQT